MEEKELPGSYSRMDSGEQLNGPARLEAEMAEEQQRLLDEQGRQEQQLGGELMPDDHQV